MKAEQMVEKIQQVAEQKKQYLVKHDAGVYYVTSEKDGAVRIMEVAVGGTTRRSCWQADRVIWSSKPSTTLDLWSDIRKIERWAYRPSRMFATPGEAMDALVETRQSNANTAAKELKHAEDKLADALLASALYRS